MSHTVVFVHGGFHGGWCWRKVAVPLRRLGWDVYTPSLTGMADRSHLLSSDVTLGTRIADITGLIESEELTGVTLCAHSAGGTVATGVADSIPDRIARLVYLDAVVPESGQSQLDVCEGPEGIPDFFRKAAADAGDGWRIPVLREFDAASFGVTDLDDAAWVNRRLTPDSLPAFTEPLALCGGFDSVPAKTYVRSSWPVSFADRLMTRFGHDDAWTTHRVDHVGHDMMIAAPDDIVAIINDDSGNAAR